MKVSVRGHIFDLLAFRGLTKKRAKRFQGAATPLAEHPVNALAGVLHPDRLDLVITQIRDETKTAKTFRLERAPGSGQTLPYFRAGQYLSLMVDVDGARITRPYSLSSAPYESLGEGGYYEITIRKAAEGFLTGHIWANWRVGTAVASSGPVGLFYHEPLRDAAKIVGLAGGSGITPFRSMAREIVHGDLDVELVLLYGSSAEDDIVAYDELAELERVAPDKIKVIHVLSCEEVSLPGCEQGFITADIIRRYADVENASFFICGPRAMYEFAENELARLGLPPRRMRRESYGESADVGSYLGFPAGVADATFQLRVEIGGQVAEISARGSETVLVAMERANLAPPSRCRSGE